MNQMLIDLLSQLKSAALAPYLSTNDLISAMKDVLSWLNQPENNTDENCKQIDRFVLMEIMLEKRFEEIPEDIRNILFDMGAQLDDTYTAPEIAENFESTPSQLLARVQKL